MPDEMLALHSPAKAATHLRQFAAELELKLSLALSHKAMLRAALLRLLGNEKVQQVSDQGLAVWYRTAQQVIARVSQPVADDEFEQMCEEAGADGRPT
jgi:hypothetical protein